MIPGHERLLELSRLREGSLDEIPFAVLLTALAVGRRSLVLELRRAPFEKRIVIDEGVPVDCRSNLVHETLGRFMVATGKLSEDDFNATLSEASTRGIPHGEAMVDRGLITPDELYRVLQQSLARKLLDPFTWTMGTFKVDFDVPHVESPLKVRVAQLVLTGVVKFANQADVDRNVSPLIGKKLVVHPDPPFPPDELRFTGLQKKIVDAIGDGKRIDELAVSTDISYEEIARILYALAIIGFVIPADQIPKGTRSASAKAASDAVAPRLATPTRVISLDSLDTPENERIRSRVMKDFLSFRKLDPFELLGLREDATPGEIDESYLSFANRVAPARFDDEALRDLSDKARELFLAGARAYATLADSQSRMSLIDRRKTLRAEREVAHARDRFRIQTDLIDADEQFRKGKTLLDAGKQREALSLLEFAVDCDAQNATYLAELAWCRFLDSPLLVTGNRCLADLKRAMRIDPDCGLAWYYAGLIHEKLGNVAEAEENLRASIKKMTPDRRPIEALKNLKRA